MELVLVLIRRELHGVKFKAKGRGGRLGNGVKVVSSFSLVVSVR